MGLHSDGKAQIVQAFPLTEGKTNKTTGTIIKCRIIVCVEDGSAAIAQLNDTIVMVAGDIYSFSISDVTIVSGKFHLA